MSPTPEPAGELFLNIGCGDHKLPGFVNIDLDPAADLQADVTRGLPYANGTVHGIFSEHFIEHLTQAQGVAFFRECRRVLVNGGRVRVATPDLDFLVKVFDTDWRLNMAEWSKYGYEWIANRAEQLNLVMREWGHRWLYNEEEMVRLASVAGLEPLERCALGESSEPRLRGVEYRDGSTLIYEFAKARPAVRTDDPLVSIVITAYNPRYFTSALESALAQTYRHLEIVIGDDRPSGEIERLVSRHADERIRYHRNQENLGEKRNLIECFARARGEYVKFLNDDDLLHPECVERMVRCLNRCPDVTLVTSHRQCIDAEGKRLPDLKATRRPVRDDGVIDGVSLARALLEGGLNFVGEPSTVMFRRQDLENAQPNILSFGGRECIGTVDVTMWTHLLSRGDAIYLVDTLSYFRLHPEQAQRSDDYVQRQAGPAREQILFDARRMGLLARKGPLKLTATRLLDLAPRAQDPPLSAPREQGGTPRGLEPGLAAVSIVIPVFNNVADTRTCLEAIRRNTPAGRYEIVIVDNGSTDGTAELLASLPAETARTVSNPENLGFARACNQGARAAAGRYLLFLNNDTEPEPGWLEPLIEVLDADDSVAAVGSKLLFPDRTIQHAGVIIVEDRTAAAPLVARHVFYREPGDKSEANRARTYQALTAACLLIRKSAFEETGGFDEGYWNGYEDVDLCLQFHERSWKVVYQPRSVVVHHESKSGPERYRKVDENIARLQSRWRGKVVPDVVVENDGTSRRIDSGFALPYAPPSDEPWNPPPAGPAGSASPGLGEPSLTLVQERQANLVSIVILTCNQLRYTRECVASIQQHTPEPHEILFVDNGSTDGTVAWLERLVLQHFHYRLITNPTNLGFSKGCNQGIAASRGEFVLLLNNDVVVTPGWLSGMLECLQREPEAGFVGPMTNAISGPQQVTDPGYESTRAGLDEYAIAFRERHRGRRLPLRRIVGFCMLFRSALVNQVGWLDERFGSGNFEDDDWCLRAALMGMKNVVAGDVFVHHYGSRTFAGNRVSFAGVMTGNRRRFVEKWRSVSAATPLGARLHALQAEERAADLHAGGETEKAIEHLVRGLERAPRHRPLYHALVRILIDSQKLEEALDMLRRLPADRDDPLAIALAGRCLEALDRTDEAEATADRLLASDPGSAAGLDLKGVVAYKRGDAAMAAEWCRRAADADPGLGEPVRNLGVLEWAAGRTTAALDLLERSFVLDPGNADSATAYHSAVTAEQAWERASRIFAEARAVRPRDRRVCFFLIDTLIRQARHADAMEIIEEAMVTFGIDDGFLAAALDVRAKIGPLERPPAAMGRGVSLCMIVRNEERHLARCLASLKPVVAEMIVVDTGSTDRTRGIATAFGAKVFEHPWTGDFSEARNAALSRASRDTILVMDADELLASQDHEAFAALAGKRGGKPGAWSFVTRNYVVPVNNAGWTANDGSYPQEEAGSGWIPSAKVRLFPNRETLRFSGAVHERVEPSLAGIPVKEARIPVHHYGKIDEREDLRKGEVYHELGKKKLEEAGDDVTAISELAIQSRVLGKYDEAVTLWRRVVALRPDLAIAWFNMGSALLELDRFDEALSASRKALELNPDQKEIAYNCALAELYTGDAARSIALLEELARRAPDYPVAQALLAASLSCAGRTEEAAARFAALREQGFGLSDYLAVLVRKLGAAGRDDFGQCVADAARDGSVAMSTRIDEERF